MFKALMRHYYRYKLTKHRNDWVRAQLATHDGKSQAEKAISKWNTYMQKLERLAQ